MKKLPHVIPAPIGMPPITAQQIRLLTLGRDAVTDESTFRLETFDKEDRCSDYVTISYAWEDETPVAEIQLEDGRSLPLSRTLACLIDALRTRHERISVWIDAICINQADDVEKADQVRSMGEVYANAKQVVVWLGSAQDNVAPAYQFLLSTVDLVWPQGFEAEDDTSQWDNLFPILARPWFRRLWVIQEAVLGADVVFMYGDLPAVQFAHLANCTYAIWRYSEEISAADWNQPGQIGLRCFSRLLTIREEYFLRGEVPYELLLQAGRFCATTDPRDRIFGLRGIAAPCNAVPPPDYSVPLDKVADSEYLLQLHARVSRALLCHGNSLDSFALAGLADRPQHVALPSWAVNLQHVNDGEPLTMADNGDWNAGGTSSSQIQELSACALSIKVDRDDQVIQCCRPFVFDDIHDLRLCMNSVMGLWRFITLQSTKPDQRRRMWRDQVVESMLFGLNIDDDPITGEERSSFDEWLRTISGEETEATSARLDENVFHRTAYVRIDGWRAGLTRQGNLVLGPDMLEIGDRICTVPGCRFPLALREHKESVTSGDEVVMRRSNLDCELISWCYVNGWMHGERSGSGGDVKEFVLH